MGTSKDALNAGSVSYKHVVAIEGYRYILTNATTAQAITAWAGTGYTQALGGLFVEVKTGQSIQPWKAFSVGTTFQFHVRDQDNADTFGIDTHKRDAGGETSLALTADRDDTTITVDSTDDFASSGEAFIGTECFGYSGKTATTFTGCTRGKYSPFPASGTAFAQHHRVLEQTGLSPKLRPIVSENPRTWIGKWCGVWIHRYVNGVLDTKAQAHLVFAGRIADIQDDPSLATSVTVQHVLDCVNESTVFRDGWSAKLQPGLFLQTGYSFVMAEWDGDPLGTVYTATPLAVVPGTPVSAYEIQEGFYTNDELYGKLNEWWAQAWSDGDLLSKFWTWEAPSQQYPTPHTKIYWDRSASLPSSADFIFGAPESVMLSFGFVTDYVDQATHYITRNKRGSSKPQSIVAQNPPSRAGLFTFDLNTNNGYTANLLEQRGTFIDQYDFFPAQQKVFPKDSLAWGFFLVNNEFLMFGAHDGATQIVRALRPIFRWSGAPGIGPLGNYTIPDGQTEVEIRQILILESSLQNILKYFFYSTGTLNYNHLDWDVFSSYGLGLAIPAPLLGANFENSIDAIPEAFATQLIVVDRPTKFADLFNGDMVFRRAFLRWKDGGLQFRTWATPTEASAIAALTEANKAAMVGDSENHRSSTLETDEWQYPIVKIKYNRDVSDLSNADGFRSSLTIQDPVAIDDAGGVGKSLTIPARNTYDDDSGTGSIKDLLGAFVAAFPLHSRPATRLVRSIGQRHFEALAVGDVVTITDNYARDPETGIRRVTTRPAFITKTSVSYGGARHDADEPAPAGGEVELFLLPSNRFAAYVPSADVDDTVSGGGFASGYNSGTSTLRCYANRYSVSPEPADASHFVAGYKIRIVEKDPANPASPTMWERTILSVTNNDIVLTAALAAPAWDSTKKYRILWDSYSDNVVAQQDHCFQADDDNGMIESARPPREYAVGQGSSPTGISLAALTDEVEIPPENTYGDGEPRDVGADLVLARLLNNLIDVKTANHSPQLGAVMSGSGGTYNLVSIEPHFVTIEQLGVITRQKTVAVFLRSTNGASASVRVSFVRNMPTTDSLADIDRGQIYDDVVFSTSSTTWSTSSDDELDLRVKSEPGFVFILIEVTSNAETRGLAKFVEGEREGFAVIGA